MQTWTKGSAPIVWKGVVLEGLDDDEGFDDAEEFDDTLEAEEGLGFERERRAHATAWLAPLPPEPVEKELAVSVSPGLGKRLVRVMRSVLREPMTVIVGIDIAIPPKSEEW